MGEAAPTFGFSGLSVTVGADGLLLDWGALHARKFVPYRGLARAVAEPFGISLEMTEGSPLFFFADESRERVIACIADASSAWKRAHPDPFETLLSRNKRPIAAWMAALETATEGRSDYRGNAVPIEGLWEAVEVAGDPSVRVGAAIALRRHLDDTGRARLRDLATASASPVFRAVVASVVAGEHADALAEVLAREDR